MYLSFLINKIINELKFKIDESMDPDIQYQKLKRAFVDKKRVSKLSAVNVKIKLTEEWFDHIYQAKLDKNPNIIEPKDD